MERKIAGLVGTLAGLATLGSSGAHAAADATAMQQEPLSVTSYADLLQPIPNATEVLKAHNAKLMEQARSAPPELERVQWHRDGEHRHHHHHHHHHGY